MGLRKKLSALHVPHHKNTAAMHSVEITPPAEVLLPMNMHAGSPAVPVVNVGDYVRIGQLIAKAEGRNSVPVHATVSGTVTSIEDCVISGKKTKAIRIESDGKMEPSPDLRPRDPQTLEEFLAALAESGIVGLGGAGFPLYAKLDAAKRNHIKTVLVNGAECEPFITSDHRTMLEHTDLVVKGVQQLKKFLGSEEFIIAIEDNKPDAIAKLTEAFKDMPEVNVKPLKAVYPQGAKQVLLYNAAGLVTKEGQRLASLGYIIINVTTLAKMALFLETGMPLVDKIVTVDGSAIRNPSNFVVPIGTSITHLVEQAGGFKEEPGKVIKSGPMMGKSIDTTDEPVVKTTNAVLLFNKKDSAERKASACIHCGRCVNTCPLNLNPCLFSRAMEIEDEAVRFEILDSNHVHMCMSCGCCSYVCPANRPLVSINAEAKDFVKKTKAKLEEQKGEAK